MKKVIYLIWAIALISIYPACGQEPIMHWLRGYNGNSKVNNWVSRSADGGVIVNIQATDTGLDGACTIAGNTSAFLKFSPDASTLMWTRCYRGSFNDSGFFRMYEQPAGDLVLGGECLGPNTHHFLMRKETSAGGLVWRKAYGDGAEALLDEMIPTSDGGYILAGRTFYTDTNFTFHYGIFDQSDVGILRVDSNGDKKWSRVVGGTYDDRPQAVLPAPGDGCYIAGTTFSADNDFAGINHGGSDCFVIRYDANGSIIWKKCFGGSVGETGATAVPNGKGGLILSGVYYSTDGDRTHFPDYGCRIWIVEIDSMGSMIWDNCYGGGAGGNCYPYNICKAADGSIWVGGVSTNSGAQVGTAYGRDDAWFLHVDSGGNYINSRVLGSSSYDMATMVFPLTNGNVLAGGFYDALDGTFAGMLTHSTWPYSSAFLTVFSPQTDAVTTIDNGMQGKVKIYPNPANEFLNIHSSQPIQTLTVVNILGQKMLQWQGNATETRLDVSQLAVGLYLVAINNSVAAKFERR